MSARKRFLAAPEHLQKLVREILEEERKVQHKQRRPNIHQNIYDHVKRVVK